MVSLDSIFAISNLSNSDALQNIGTVVSDIFNNNQSGDIQPEQVIND